MPKRAFDTLSEPMFYVLMALSTDALCGADIANWVARKTNRRITIGPGTLYTILPKLCDEDIIREISTDGRKRTYELTDRGRTMYRTECDRLRRCVADIDATDSPFVLSKEA